MRFITVFVLLLGLLIGIGCKTVPDDCPRPPLADVAQSLADCLPTKTAPEEVQSQLAQWEYEGQVMAADLLTASTTPELVLTYRAGPQPYDPQGKLAVLEYTQGGWRVVFESPAPQPDIEENGRNTLAGNWQFDLDQVANVQENGSESILFRQWRSGLHRSSSYTKLLSIVGDKLQILLVEDDFKDHQPTYLVDGPYIYSQSNFGNGVAITRTLTLENGQFVQTAETINPAAAELQLTLPDGTQFVSFDGECGWLCYHRYGLYRIREGEQFHYTPMLISSIVQLRDGHVYVGSGDIFRVVGDELQLVTDDFAPLPEGNYGLLVDMEMTSTGEIWAATRMQLIHFGHEQSTIYYQAIDNVTIAPDDSVWTLGWDGVANSNCCVFHVKDGIVTTYQKGETLPVSEQLAAEIYANQQ